MKHLIGLYEEIKIELEKVIDCEYYSGIIFVHPDDVESVVRFVYNLCDADWNSKRNIFTFDNGSILLIDTLERDGSGCYPHFDYAGCQFTSIIIHCKCFDGYKGNNENFIMYMLSRKRSESKFSSRMVIL